MKLYGHEGQHLEFKSSFLVSAGNQSEDQQFVVFKAACAMMNADGGVILIGVDDKTSMPCRGKYYGVQGDKLRLHKKNNDEYARYINSQIKKYFEDDKYVRGIMWAEETDDDDVVRINVMRANKLIYITDQHGQQYAYRREGASSRLMTQVMISQRKRDVVEANMKNRKENKEERIRLDVEEAISNKRKVLIRGYMSSNSNLRSDRVVEPVCFLCGGRSVWAYDELRQSMRQFRLKRMSDVEIMNEAWENESEHRNAYVDAFEWTRDTHPSIHICMTLGPTAVNALTEAAPESRKYITECADDTWILDADVHSLEPVKSFCKVCGDIIDVLCPDELRIALGLKPLAQVENPEETETAQQKVEEVKSEQDNGVKSRCISRLWTFFANIIIRSKVS